MSDRLVDLPEEDWPLLAPALPVDDVPEDPEDPPELPVEYFVEVVLEDSCLTSVPKSEQLSHTSSSAPSTFTVFGADVSAPHISH